MSSVSLLDEMKACKTVKQCIETALVDSYGEEEQAGSWHTCIEELFGKFKRVKVLGQEVALEGFDVCHSMVVAICSRGEKQIKLTLDSIEFPKLNATEKLWLRAWQKYSDGYN